MDANWVELATKGGLIVALVLALRWAINRLEAITAARDVEQEKQRTQQQTREDAAAKRCDEERQRSDKEVAALVARVEGLEKRSHDEMRADQQILLEVVRDNSETMKQVIKNWREATPGHGSPIQRL